MTIHGRSASASTRSLINRALVGRNVTFPGRDDPRAVAHAVEAMKRKEL